MGLFTRKVRPREVKTRALGMTDELGKFLQFGTTTAATPSSALNLYEQSTAVSVPINMVVDAFSVIEPVLQEGEKTFRFQHDVLDRLKQPSSHYTRELFFEMMAKNFLITGEAEVVALGRVDKPPLELQPLSPAVVTPVQGKGGLIGSFTVAGVTMTGVYRPERRGAAVRYFDGGLRELKQIRNWSSKNNSLLRGQSLLVSAAREARQHILGTEHNVSLLEKGPRRRQVRGAQAEGSSSIWGCHGGGDHWRDGWRENERPAVGDLQSGHGLGCHAAVRPEVRGPSVPCSASSHHRPAPDS
jgi:hypothetical protein